MRQLLQAILTVAMIVTSVGAPITTVSCLFFTLRVRSVFSR